MALPSLSGLVADLPVEVGDVVVTFQVAPIPGKRYGEIIDAGRDADGRVSDDDVAVPLLAAGIIGVYSSVESQVAEFTEDDARELWEEWPEFARARVLRAVIAASTKGPGADPFGGSKRTGNGDASTRATSG